MMGVMGRILFLFLMMSVFLNCALDEPKAPSWEVDLQIPLASKNITIHELLSDQSNVFTFQDGLVGLRAEGFFDTSRVGDNLKIPDIEEQIDVDIPNLTIPRLNADDADFALKEFYPDIVALDGQQAVIPAFQFTNIMGQLMPEQDVVAIKLTHGYARLIYENNLLIDLENIVFTLIEPATGEIKMESPKIERISAGARDSIDIDIGNKELTCDGKWYVQGDSPGSRGASIAVDADASVSLLVDFVHFRVSSVTGRGSAFYIEHDDSVMLDPEIHIRSAAFNKGTLEFEFYNGLPIDLDVVIESPQIRNKMTNRPLEFSVRAARRATHSIFHHLEDYTIEFDDNIFGDQYLNFTFEADGESGEDEIVTISESDSIKVKFKMTNASMEHFQGSLDQLAISIPDFDRDIDVPKDLHRFNGLNMADAHLCLNFYNNIAMPIQMRGKFVGIGNGGASATLNIDSDISPCDASGEVLTSVQFEAPENKQILSIMNLAPQHIQFSGSALIGDGLHEGLITPESYIRGRYVLETPAKLSWEESVLEPDTTYLQINPEGDNQPDLRNGVVHIDSKTTNSLRKFVINAEIENHLPVGATIEYRFADVLSQAEEADIVLAPVDVSSAILDVDGRTEKSHKQSAEIILSGDDISVLHNDSDSPRLVTLVAKIRLHGTDGEQVKVYSSDFISISSMAQVAVGVNME